MRRESFHCRRDRKSPATPRAAGRRAAAGTRAGMPPPQTSNHSMRWMNGEVEESHDLWSGQMMEDAGLTGVRRTAGTRRWSRRAAQGVFTRQAGRSQARG